MSQTVVAEQKSSLVGQKYALLKDSVLSYAAEERVPFGRFTSLGTDKDLQAKLPALATDITSIKSKRGVALQQHSIENVANGPEPGYPSTNPMSILEKGGAYIEAEEVFDFPSNSATRDGSTYEHHYDYDNGYDEGDGSSLELVI